MATKGSTSKAPIPNLTYILCERGWNVELAHAKGFSDGFYCMFPVGEEVPVLGPAWLDCDLGCDRHPCLSEDERKSPGMTEPTEARRKPQAGEDGQAGEDRLNLAQEGDKVHVLTTMRASQGRFHAGRLCWELYSDVSQRPHLVPVRWVR